MIKKRCLLLALVFKQTCPFQKSNLSSLRCQTIIFYFLFQHNIGHHPFRSAQGFFPLVNTAKIVQNNNDVCQSFPYHTLFLSIISILDKTCLGSFIFLMISEIPGR